MESADRLLHSLRRFRDPTARRLAWTVRAWQPSIIEGLRIGITNGRTEGYNRGVKHVGRIAFGFRNQENHKRRIRFACTSASRRAPTRILKPLLILKTRDACTHGNRCVERCSGRCLRRRRPVTNATTPAKPRNTAGNARTSSTLGRSLTCSDP